MKLLKTLLVGFATGAAATYFLKTREGQETKEKILKSVDDYKANPEDYRQFVKEKATDYKDVAVATLKEYKEKFETGELTTDDVLKTVKDKVQEVADLANATISEMTGQDKDVIIDAEDVVPVDPEEVVEEVKSVVDDIVINYNEAVTPESVEEETEPKAE